MWCGLGMGTPVGVEQGSPGGAPHTGQVSSMVVAGLGFVVPPVVGAWGDGAVRVGLAVDGFDDGWSVGPSAASAVGAGVGV